MARARDQRVGRSQVPIWLYLTFFAGWIFASVLILRGSMVANRDNSPVTPAWFFVVGTGVLVVALVDRDVAARRRASTLLRGRQSLIESIGVVTDPRLTQLPLYQLLDELLRRARRVLGADTALVFLLDRETGLLELSASSGLPQGASLPPIPVGDGVLGRVASGRRGVALPDAPADNGVPGGTASVAAVPLVAEGQLLGVLEVGTARRRQFVDDELRLLQVVADRAAVAIDASRLEREAQRARLAAEGARRRLALLADAGRLLAGSFDEVEDMAEGLGTMLVPAFVDWFAFHQVDDGPARVLAWHAGPDVDVGTGVGVAGHGAWGLAVEAALGSGTSTLAWGDQLVGDAYRPARALALTSVLIVPVVIAGVIRGAMIFGTADRRRGLRTGDMSTFEDLAARVGVAIERVLLGAETQRSAVRAARHAAQLQRLTEGAFAINAALATPALAQVVAEQAARVLDSDAARVELRDEFGAVVEGHAGGARLPRIAHRAASPLTDAAGTVVGAVTVARAGTPFGPEDDAILASLAQIASVASANAHLYGTIQDSEARLRALYDASPVAIVELDDEQRALRWNRAAESLFGWASFSPDVVGTMAVPDAAIGVVVAALEGEARTSVEVMLGDVDVDLVAVRLRETGRAAGVVLAAVDVTERKQVAEQLQQAQRMESMARMAGGIAHDFNNVLMVIIGYADLLLRRPIDDASRNDVEGMRAAAARAAEFTRKLLTISRRQIVQPQVVDVGDAVRSLGDVLAVMVGSEVKLELDVSDGAPVRIDPAQFEQLVLNLVLNARDAMPGGGSIAIHAWGSDDGAWSVIEVADDGEGMDAATLERCFEPFFSTKDRTKGTGLGLSTAYGVVSQAGGDIDVDSRPGHGTTFTVRLPVATAEVEGAERAPLGGGALRILLVDDEPDVRAIVSDLLELEGHEVVVAADGEAALATLDDAVPDILITDVVMPGMRGPDLARLVTARHPEVRVVLMSSHVDDELAVNDRVDAATFLAKPFSGDDLVATIAAVSGRDAQASKR